MMCLVVAQPTTRYARRSRKNMRGLAALGFRPTSKKGDFILNCVTESAAAAKCHQMASMGMYGIEFFVGNTADYGGRRRCV